MYNYNERYNKRMNDILNKRYGYITVKLNYNYV